MTIMTLFGPARRHGARAGRATRPGRTPAGNRSRARCLPGRGGHRPATNARAAPLVFVLLALAPAHGPADEAIYRWVDEDGGVHYGDRPREADAEAVEIPAAPPPDPGAAARRERREKLLEVFGERRAERRTAAAEARARREERERRCERARARRHKYETASAIYEKDGEGQRRILSDAEHAEVRRTVREEVERWCGPPPGRE